MNNCKTGRNAEKVAAGYLKARGYQIWKTNWRWGKRELDLRYPAASLSARLPFSH